MFFKDSAHGKHIGPKKDYRARRVYGGKAQSRVLQGKLEKRQLRGLRNHAAFRLRDANPNARASLFQPLQTSY